MGIPTSIEPRWKYGSRDEDKAKADIGHEGTTVLASRYHSQVIWGTFVLAVVLGTIVAAAVYAAYRWPADEPIADAAEVQDDAAPTPPVADTSGEAASEA